MVDRGVMIRSLAFTLSGRLRRTSNPDEGYIVRLDLCGRQQVLPKQDVTNC